MDKSYAKELTKRPKNIDGYMNVVSHGVYIKVRVKTGQKKEIVEVTPKGVFKIAVKEKAERNSANARIIKIIAERLGIPTKKVRIVSGHHSPSKLLGVA